jgi:dienelactone hydrolase
MNDMMKKILVLSMLMVSARALFAQIDRRQTCANITTTAWNAMIDGKFEYVFNLFTPDMKRQLSIEELKDIWTNLELQMGKYKSTGITSVEENGPYTLTVTPVQFEKMPLLLKINIDSFYRIAGLFVVPGGEQYTPPSYVNTLSFIEYKLNFGKAPFTMDGMLSVPRANRTSPVVIILGGSGPTDKDGTIGYNKPLKDIAWGLASRGVAVFRFDKRTQRHGVTLFGSTYLKTFSPEQEYVEDALEIIAMLKKHAKIDSSQIYLLGHSQGGMMAPRIAQRAKSLKGIILLSANASSLQDLMIEQLDYLYSYEGPDDDGKKAEAQKLKVQAAYALRKDLKPDAPVDLLPMGTPASYWIYLNNYNQVEIAKQLKRERILVLQGERDYQVPVKEYDKWRTELSSKPNAQFQLFPQLNHLMMPGEGKPSPDEYSKANHVAESVLTTLTDWIKQQGIYKPEPK